MIPLCSFHILTSGSPLLIFLLVILFAAFSFYVYKYTIPKVSTGLRIFLIALRALIFILIIVVIFEPVLILTHNDKIESKTLIFVDNSNSLAVKDSVNRLNKVFSFLDEINSASKIKSQIFSFGGKVDSLKKEEQQKIKFSDSRTNFSNIIDLVKRKGAEVNSVVILSDGIITDGIDPTYQAEKLQVPVFTVGIGDTTEKKDQRINNILYNQIIYAGKPTTIEVSVMNSGFSGKNTRVTLYEENKSLDSKDIVLNESGLNKVEFNYKPLTGGEKKLSVSLTPLAGEFTTANNSRTFYLNVLDTKLKVAVIAGSPSADVSAISKALAADKNIQVKKLIQISGNKFWNDAKQNIIDSVDVLFMLDFPSSSTPQSLIEKISSLITTQNKPYFFLLSGNVSLNRLSSLEKVLPFAYSKAGNDFIQVQPEIITESFSNNFSTSSNQKEIWNNLPPVSQFATEFSAKPGSNVLVKSKVRNISIGNPLIISSSLGKQRSLAILGSDIWRWQLQTAEKNPEFFDNFINDIVKWLSISSQQKQFSVTTDKKIYSPDEQINFSAQLYDQTFSPIDTTKIDLQIFHSGKKFDLALKPIGNGIYTSEFTANEAGDYTFEAAAQLNNNRLKSNVGRFSVDETKIEFLDTRMRDGFLKSLAKSANGEYYTIENFSAMIKKLSDINSSTSKEKSTTTEYHLWSDEWILVLIILLFATEWFIRKRFGML